MFNLIIRRIRATHVFIFLVLFYGLMDFLKMPAHLLMDDEAFYFFQARAMAHGTLVFFDRTNPYLFPLTLAPFHDLPLMLLRLLPVCFMALAISRYFHLLRRHADGVLALLASLLLAFHPRVIEFAMQLYSEGLFLFLLFLGFEKLFDILGGKTSWKDFILLGVYLGLALEARAFFPIIPFFFAGWILWRTGMRHAAKAGVAVAISLVLYLPYYLANGATYFKDKFFIVFDGREIVDRLSLSSAHFGFIFMIALAAAVALSLKKAHCRRKDLLGVFVSFSLVYVAFFVLLVNCVFARYFLFCLPACALLIAQFLFYENFRECVRFAVMGVFLLLLALWAGDMGGIPSYKRNVHFLPGGPVEYLELGSAHQTYLYQGILSLPSYAALKRGEVLAARHPDGVPRLKELPVFDQANHTIAQYEFDFYVPGNAFRYIFFAHACDGMRVELDGKELTRNGASNVFVPFQINLGRPLDAGFHHMVLYVYNYTNIGGIGQVLLSKDDLTKALGLASEVERAAP